MRRYTVSLLVSVAVFLAAVLPPDCRGEESMLDQGVREYRSENFEEAAVALEAARQQEPSSSVAAFYLGLTMKQTGNYQRAAELFRDALNLSPPILDASLELAETLFTLGDTAGAKKALSEAERTGVRPAAVAFLKGVVLAKDNEIEAAIGSFETARQRDPALAQQVEFQIAILHARERRISQARKSLKALIEMDPASDAASLAKEYETTFSRLVDEYRGWRVTAGANYLYDDNVISNPDNEARLDQRDEDSGFVGSFRVDYSPLIDPPWGISAQYQFQTTRYGNIDTMDTLVNSLALVPSYSQKAGAFSFPLSYSHVLLHDKKYMATFSAKPTQSMLLPLGHIAQLSAGYSRRELLRPPFLADEDRDGNIYSAGAGYVVPFLDARGMVSLRYEFSYDDAEGGNWINRGNRLNVGANIPVAGGLSLQLNGDMFDQEYVYRNTSFGEKRDDTVYTGLAGITWELTNNFSLNVQYSHTRSVSNIDAYDYRRNTVLAGIEAGF